MRTLIKLLLIAAVAQSSLTLAQAITTKEAIATYFGADGKPPQLKSQKSGGAVEVCIDTCDFYRFNGAVDEQVVWDIVFLHQYFLNTPYHLRKFKTDYRDVSADVLSRYKSLCPSISGANCRSASLTTLLRVIALRMRSFATTKVTAVRLPVSSQIRVSRASRPAQSVAMSPNHSVKHRSPMASAYFKR